MTDPTDTTAAEWTPLLDALGAAERAGIIRDVSRSSLIEYLSGDLIRSRGVFGASRPLPALGPNAIMPPETGPPDAPEATRPDPETGLPIPADKPLLQRWFLTAAAWTNGRMRWATGTLVDGANKATEIVLSTADVAAWIADVAAPNAKVKAKRKKSKVDVVKEWLRAEYPDGPPAGTKNEALAKSCSDVLKMNISESTLRRAAGLK